MSLLEAELGGLLQALLAARRRPHLAGEADLAERSHLGRDRLVGEGRNHREAHR
jgi:hypothetical protein